MMSVDKQKNIIKDLLIFLAENKEVLFALNKKSTQDSRYWILKDFYFVFLYLKKYIKNNNNQDKMIKPKGKIFIILSYNEPLILSIIPVMNAIFAGNKVYLKPSKKSFEIVDLIWNKSGIVKKYNLNFKIITVNQEKDLINTIKSVVAVYFFGGLNTAKKIAKLCAQYFVEFIPEIETADCMVIKYEKENKIDNKFIKSLFYQSFSHAGQSCQRIQGVYVSSRNYDSFKKLVKEEFNKFINSEDLRKHISSDYLVDKNYYQSILNDIKESGAEQISSIKENFPIIVDNPDDNSYFIKNAYFYPTFWIKPFNSDLKLLDLIKLRKFFLGLNIMTDDKNLLNLLIDKTKYSRYTLNTSHIDIRDGEGWGGMWPSGYFGYRSWLSHFSNKYVCIEK